MFVIINADDLGADMSVNNASFDLMSSGLISSATIMANALYCDDAVKKAESFKGISFGIHLNITSFSPLSSSSDLKAILDRNGYFIEKSKLQKIRMTSSLSSAIYSEFCCQVDKLLSMGVHISHIDSHEHVHTIPGMFPVLKRLQKRYGIRRVRISRNIYLPGYKISRFLKLKKKIYNFMLTNYYVTRTTSGFGNLEEFYENVKRNNIHYNTVEIMVHPGADKFRNENKLLIPSWHKEVCPHFELINYNQL